MKHYIRDRQNMKKTPLNLMFFLLEVILISHFNNLLHPRLNL